MNRTGRRRLPTRRLVAAAVIVFMTLLAGGTAHADPAGPTDYRSEILSIEPSTPSVSFEVIGGDSFVQMTADPGTEVLVTGYFGEPYLRFLADGTVEENRNSPTTYQNEERYGSDAPDFASADADPIPPIAANPACQARGSFISCTASSPRGERNASRVIVPAVW